MTNIYKDAIQVQDACNLSGVAHSLCEAMKVIREEPDCNGTDYVNRHPVVTMYLSKMADLNGMSINSGEFNAAYQICKERS